jgi:YVTN family beta-propeller protein
MNKAKAMPSLCRRFDVDPAAVGPATRTTNGQAGGADAAKRVDRVVGGSVAGRCGAPREPALFGAWNTSSGDGTPVAGPLRALNHPRAGRQIPHAGTQTTRVRAIGHPMRALNHPDSVYAVMTTVLVRPERLHSRRHVAFWVALLIATLAVPLMAQAARIYVSNEDGESVTVLDADSGKTVATVPVGKRPRGIKLSHDGKHLYVAVSGLPKCPPSVPDEECAKLKRDLTADGIAVIDTGSLKLVKLLKAGSDPEQFDLSPDGQRLFISNEDAASLSVLNVGTGALEATVHVGTEPEGVRVSPNGKWVIVTNETGNSVTVIDAKTLAVHHTMSVGQRPRDVAFTADSATIYVSGELDSSVSRASVPNGESVEKLVQLRADDRPMGIVLDAKHNRVFVSTGRGGAVAVISLGNSSAHSPSGGAKLVKEIPVGKRPWGIALSRDGTRLYTANGPSNDVSIIDTGSLSVIKRVPVGSSPWGLVLGP